MPKAGARMASCVDQHQVVRLLTSTTMVAGRGPGGSLIECMVAMHEMMRDARCLPGPDGLPRAAGTPRLAVAEAPRRDTHTGNQ